MDLYLEVRGLFLQLDQPSHCPEFPHEKGPRRMSLGNFFLRMYSVGDEFGKQGGGPSWYSRWLVVSKSTNVRKIQNIIHFFLAREF